MGLLFPVEGLLDADFPAALTLAGFPAFRAGALAGFFALGAGFEADFLAGFFAAFLVAFCAGFFAAFFSGFFAGFLAGFFTAFFAGFLAAFPAAFLGLEAAGLGRLAVLAAMGTPGLLAQVRSKLTPIQTTGPMSIKKCYFAQRETEAQPAKGHRASAGFSLVSNKLSTRVAVSGAALLSRHGSYPIAAARVSQQDRRRRSCGASLQRRQGTGRKRT
ncbi:MAG: hypothetical protein KF696_03430 [Planctomycetes bacterium]|nr:hypothetical protein [Planctomycetota bacterium]MCW8135058.1 hypothetical protein [Planctomycetota bacterium]